MDRAESGRTRGLGAPRGVVAVQAVGLVAAAANRPDPRGDAVAYLFSVTLRPDYNFPNAETALAYGHGICGKIAEGHTDPQIMGDVKADFNTTDEYSGVLRGFAGGQRALARVDLAAMTP